MANYVFNPFTGALTPVPPASGLAPGVIVNADVSASAAIAGTKVAPNFGAQTVITTGSGLIGTATSLTTLYSGAGKFQVASNDATTIQGYAFSSAGVDYSATLELSRARNTQASPTIVANGDYIGQINFAGYNTNFQRGATIYALVDGEPGTAGDTTDMPGKLVFATTPNGSATPTTRMSIDSAGLVTLAGALDVPLGTAALPSISFTGDTNTGIYSPGADQVAVATNGSGRVTIDGSGRLLVGQSTTGLQAARSLAWQGIGEGALYLSHSTADGNGDPFVKFGYNAGQIGSIIQAGNTGVGLYSNDYLALGSNNTERLRITSAGLVGIGTSAPSNTLHVAGTGSTQALFELTGSNGVFIGLKDSSGSLAYLGSTNGVFSIQTPGSSYSDKLVVTSAGLVGIGTTSPTELLSVNGNIWLGNGGGSGGSEMLRIWNDSGVERIHGSNNPSALAFGMGGSSSAYEAFRVDSSRRLLVGTSTARSAASQGTPRIQSAGDYQQSSVLLTNTSNDDTNCALILQKIRESSIVQNGDFLGQVAFNGYDGAADRQGATISAIVDGTPGANDMPGRLVFSTTADGAASPTPGLRIANNRQVDIYTNGGTGIWTATQRAAGTSDQVYQASYGATDFQTGTVSYKVYTNGNVENANNSYLGISDIKLKENIVDANSQWNDLKALQVRNFNFKEGQTHTQIGLIAQEVELVSPGLVNESPDRDGDGNDLGTVTKSVNYSVLYMKAVKALQEAMERIEQLETNNTDLLARVIALETA